MEGKDKSGPLDLLEKSELKVFKESADPEVLRESKEKWGL